MFNTLRKIISPNHPLRLFWHWTKAFLAAFIYRFPSDQLVCIGVTGTNGKTTTTHMIEHMLRSAGKKVAMLSTVEFKMKGRSVSNKSKKTTLSPFKTQRFLRQCVKKNVDYVVIESSSHALHQHRLFGVSFSIGVLTNITHEHLDYHGTMEAYKNAKKILFKNVSWVAQQNSSKRVKKIAHKKAIILNTADRYFEEFNQLENIDKITYGLSKGDLKASKIESSIKNTVFKVVFQEKLYSIQLMTTGLFNVENALAAIGVVLSCNVNWVDIKKGLNTFMGVPGRMERIKSPRGFDVIVDFALTPDALKKLYSNLYQAKPKRLIGIIGSCGDRDRKKRPLMGKIVAHYCDVTIVTDEEPYSEDPLSIMKAVLEGAKKIHQIGEKLHLIEDRYQAIEFAIKNAQVGDVIVITGMGCFDTRMMNDGPIKWDEREVVREIIKKNA